MKYYTILRLEPKLDKTIPQDYKVYNDLWDQEYNLVTCKNIYNWDNKNTIFIKWSILEDYMEFLNFIIVSSKIKEKIEEKWINWIDFFPIKLEQVDKKHNIIDWYYAINILNIEKKDIINQSISKKVLHAYMWIWLDKNNITWYDIFRIKWEEFEFFISEKLKNIIDKYEHSANFEEVEIK